MGIINTKQNRKMYILPRKMKFQSFGKFIFMLASMKCPRIWFPFRQGVRSYHRISIKKLSPHVSADSATVELLNLWELKRQESLAAEENASCHVDKYWGRKLHLGTVDMKMVFSTLNHSLPENARIILLHILCGYLKNYEERRKFLVFANPPNFVSYEKSILRLSQPNPNAFQRIRKATESKRLGMREFNAKNFSASYDYFLSALIHSPFDPQSLYRITQILVQRFDFESARIVISWLNDYWPYWNDGAAMRLAVLIEPIVGTPQSIFEKLAGTLLGNLAPDKDLAIVFKALDEGGIGDVKSSYYSAANCINPNTLARAEIYLRLDDPAMAESILGSANSNIKKSPRYAKLWFECLIAQSRIPEAKQYYIMAKKEVKVALGSDAIRTALDVKDFEWASEIKTYNKSLSHRNLMYFHWSTGNIKQAFLAKKMQSRILLKSYFCSKYVDSIAQINSDVRNLLIFAESGPGDEIRFASFYPALSQRLNCFVCSYTCDPRLLTLLRRSFPKIKFIPTHRLRSAYVPQKKLENFKNLPALELATVLDNNGLTSLNEADAVIMFASTLEELIKGPESFQGAPYLVACENLIGQWKLKLAPYKDKKLIGLSWRSSVKERNRLHHYLDVEQLGAILAIPDVTFINLQYDSCSEEMAWIEENYPGKIIDFKDLDQMNDFENVAALMMNLDVILTPATTVAELSGSLGCKTILFSNSAELHWRNIDGKGTDIWHNSIVHIESSPLGDKKSLVKRTVEYLTR